MACLLEPEVDQSTADLIVQLQLEDAGCYFESSKGKTREPTDEELAFQLQNEELESVSQFLLDRRMAMSFVAAVQADGNILDDSILEEENSVKDRNIARRWTEDGCSLAPGDHQAHAEESTTLDDETLDKLQILYMSGLEGYKDNHGVRTVREETGQAESSAWAAQRGRQTIPLHRCVACRDEVEFVNIARVPCRHEYCRSCLEDLFNASMTDETYCYVPECSTSINTSHIEGEVATCPNCSRTTCTSCKGRAHIGDCPNDGVMQHLLALAQENRWQRCHSCWRLVEMVHGCNHMTCRCGAQLCYNCGERWKSCSCKQWDKHRLLTRAYQIIDREANPPAWPQQVLDPEHLPETYETQEEEPRAAAAAEIPAFIEERPAPRAQTERDLLVAQTIQELRENHECTHDRWKFIRGPHGCEECYHRLPEYIFECRQCRLQACNRCRRNRL
ncbi:IBR finger domain protein [Aspergillus minisclerotigenes]|uniref:IBR finger domain protein n=1 Tax=Aspergillus minisclerotigenes TaxID=656917 RepID=A0A5N6ILR1_9EURO|nr:IBR finger domain protein [Aspergillus minisclerotigenes]